MRADAARFSPAAFLVSVAAMALVGWPGRINVDSLEQLIGAASPAFRTDWHSPIVGWLWQLGAPWLGQPGAAFALQALLLAFGMAVVPLGRPSGAWRWIAAAVEIAWRGALIALAGSISKDVMLLGLLLASLAALRLRWSGGHASWAGVAAAMLALAAMVRPPNAAMFGIAAALALPFFVRGARAWAVRLALVAACLGALTALGSFVDHRLLAARRVHPEVQLAIFDIAGTSVGAGRNLFVDMPGWSAPAGLPPVERCYTPAYWDSFAPWRECGGYSAATRDAYKRAGAARIAAWWAGALAAHPFAYAWHRAAYMRIALTGGLTDASRAEEFGGPSALNGRGSETALGALARGRVPSGYFEPWDARRLAYPLDILTLGALWLPWLGALALGACLVLLGAAARRLRAGRGPDRVVVAVTAIGIGNAAMMLVFGAAASPRYFFPLILGAWVAMAAALRQVNGEDSGGAPAIAPWPEQQSLHIAAG